MSKYNFKQLHDLLTRWGKANHSLPANSDASKQKALDALQPGRQDWAEIVTPRRYLGFWRISLASLAGLYATYLILSPYTVSFLSKTAIYSPQPYYDGGDSFGIAYSTETGLSAPQPSALQKFAERIDFTNSTPITDTREFLKTGYHADIKTRKVEKLGRQIQTMVRGYGGRIDSSNLSSKYGNISFVIPKSALESFESELGELVSEKFLTTNISSRNLLPQKQRVEEKTDSAETQLADLEEKRDKLIADHNNIIASWNKKINSFTYNINTLKQEVTTDTVRQAEITENIASLNASKSTLQKNIADNNFLYQKNLNFYDSSIASIKLTLDNLSDQDRAILDDVETVQGSVSLRWVSVVEIVNLYVPVRWLVVGGLAVFMFVVLRGRRQDDFVLP